MQDGVIAIGVFQFRVVEMIDRDVPINRHV